MEGEWINYYTGKKLEDIRIGASSAGFGNNTIRNCGFLAYPWGGWADWFCEIPTNHDVSCACGHQVELLTKVRTKVRNHGEGRYYPSRMTFV